MSRFTWLERPKLVGATVEESIIRMATDYRYHVTLDFGALDDQFRAQVLTALKQGYTPLDKVQKFLRVFSEPYKFVCGYIGKSQARFPLPPVSTEEIGSFKTRVRASCVMAGLDKGAIVNTIMIGDTTCISVALVFATSRMNIRNRDTIAIEKKGDQLLNRLNFLKGIADEIGAQTFPQREHFYNMVFNREKIECKLEGRYEHKEPETRRRRR